jgi:phage gpG-like protein
MGIETAQSGFEELRGRLRRLVEGLEHPDGLLNPVAADLAQMWRDNIDAGPNERWDPPSPRLRRTRREGTALVVTGAMRDSIVGAQTGPNEAAVGSSLEVGGGYNLLAIQEFGVDAVVNVGAFTRRTSGGLRGVAGVGRRPLGEAGVALVRGFERHMHIPRRPTAPFDWDAGELTPEGREQVQERVEEYVGGLVG